MIGDGYPGAGIVVAAAELELKLDETDEGAADEENDIISSSCIFRCRRSKICLVDVLAILDAVEWYEYSCEVLIRYAGAIGKRESGVRSGIYPLATPASCECASTSSEGAEADLREEIEHVVPERVSVLQAPVLGEVQEPFCAVLTVDLSQRAWSEASVSER